MIKYIRTEMKQSFFLNRNESLPRFFLIEMTERGLVEKAKETGKALVAAAALLGLGTFAIPIGGWGTVAGLIFVYKGVDKGRKTLGI